MLNAELVVTERTSKMGENGEDYQALLDGLLSASLTATKASNVLYARNDHGYLSSYPEWREQNEDVSKRLSGKESIKIVVDI